MPATQEPLLNGNGHSTHAANGSPPGWYDDPADRSVKRYWDGECWTEHVARPSAPVTATIETGGSSDGFFGWVRRRPALAFWGTLGLALVVGIALGAASAEEQAAKTTDDPQLAGQLHDSRGEVDSLKGDLADAESDLATTREKLSTARDRLRDARADAREAVPVLPDTADDSASDGSTSARSFSGNGGKNLGTITVGEESVLEWTNDGDIFQMWDDDFGFNVNSQGGSGDTVLPAGTYKSVTVNAIGNWTIEIRPR